MMTSPVFYHLHSVFTFIYIVHSISVYITSAGTNVPSMKQHTLFQVVMKE